MLLRRLGLRRAFLPRAVQVAAGGRTWRAQVLVEMRGERRHIALLAYRIPVQPSGRGRVAAAARARLGDGGYAGRHELALSLLRLLSGFSDGAEWNAPGSELSDVGG